MMDSWAIIGTSCFICLLTCAYTILYKIRLTKIRRINNDIEIHENVSNATNVRPIISDDDYWGRVNRQFADSGYHMEGITERINREREQENEGIQPADIARENENIVSRQSSIRRNLERIRTAWIIHRNSPFSPPPNTIAIRAAQEIAVRRIARMELNPFEFQGAKCLTEGELDNIAPPIPLYVALREMMEAGKIKNPVPIIDERENDNNNNNVGSSSGMNLTGTTNDQTETLENDGVNRNINNNDNEIENENGNENNSHGNSNSINSTGIESPNNGFTNSQNNEQLTTRLAQLFISENEPTQRLKRRGTIPEEKKDVYCHQKFREPARRATVHDNKSIISQQTKSSQKKHEKLIREITEEEEREDTSTKEFSSLIEEVEEMHQMCTVCMSIMGNSDDNDELESTLVRLLPCFHCFHVGCITSWLTEQKGECPLCKRDFYKELEEHTLTIWKLDGGPDNERELQLEMYNRIDAAMNSSSDSDSESNSNSEFVNEDTAEATGVETTTHVSQ